MKKKTFPLPTHVPMRKSMMQKMMMTMRSSGQRGSELTIGATWERFVAALSILASLLIR
jgi:hypothetical protein